MINFYFFLEIYKLLPSSRSKQILQKTQIKIVHAIFIEPSFVRKIDRQKKNIQDLPQVNILLNLNLTTIYEQLKTYKYKNKIKKTRTNLEMLNEILPKFIRNVHERY